MKLFMGLVVDARVVHHWDGSLDGAFGEVMVAVVVHHWDGSLDGVASLWLSKERVPADGTREIWEMAQNHS